MIWNNDAVRAFIMILISVLPEVLAVHSKEIIASIFLLFLYIATGYGVRKTFFHDMDTFMPGLILDYLLGSGLLGTLGIVFAIFGVFKKTVFLASTASLLATFYGYLALKKGRSAIFRGYSNTSIRFSFYSMSIALLYVVLAVHSLSSYIFHWDATVYHVVMADVVYYDERIPVISGTSHGLEMSSNYPPLYSILVAEGYLVYGGLSRFPAKLIAFFSSIATAVAMYWFIYSVTGRRVASKIGVIVLLSTPLFQLYSIYAVSYMPMISYIVGSMLYLFLYDESKQTSYIMVSALLLAYALSTNYHALEYTLFFLLSYIYLLLRKRLSLKDLYILFFIIVGLGGVWYYRNLILYGNPVYPFLQNIFGYRYDPQLTKLVFKWILETSHMATYNSLYPSLWSRIYYTLFNRVFSPGFNIVSIISMLIIVFTLVLGRYRTIALEAILYLWGIIVYTLLLMDFEWPFPRSFLMLLIPGVTIFSRISSFIISKVSSISISRSDRDIYFSVHTSIGELLLMLALFIYFLNPALPVFLYGISTYDSAFAHPPVITKTEDLTEYYYGINEPTWYFGQHKYVWDFLNGNVEYGQRILTTESKLYYVMHGLPEYFLLADSYKVENVLLEGDPDELISTLLSLNVSYIYDSPWTRTPLWTRSQLYKYLGSPWFPRAISLNPTTVGEQDNSYPAVYKVNMLQSRNPILKIESDNIIASLSLDGWLNLKDGSIAAVSESKDPIMSDASRIYVGLKNDSNSLVSVCLSYIDKGSGLVDVHVYDPIIGKWIYGFYKIYLNNTSKVVSECFVLPKFLGNYYRIALHPYESDFIIKKIKIRELRDPIPLDCIYENRSGWILVTPVIPLESSLKVTIDLGSKNYTLMGSHSCSYTINKTLMNAIYEIYRANVSSPGLINIVLKGEDKPVIIVVETENSGLFIENYTMLLINAKR